MKAFAVPCLILAALLAFSLWNGQVITDFTRQCSDTLTLADQQAGEAQWDAAEESLSQSYDCWSSRQTFLHVMVHHDEIGEAEALYRRARVYLQAQDLSSFRAELTALRSQLRILAEMEQPSIKNVL